MGRTHDSRNVTPTVQGKIKRAFIDHPDYSGVQMLGFLQRNYERYGLKKDEIPKDRKLHEIKQEWKNPKTPKDKQIKKEIEEFARPWHLGLMTKYKDLISVEAIPHILALVKATVVDNAEMIGSIQIYAEEHGLEWTDSLYESSLHVISIRQAIWISRLFGCVPDSELFEVSWTYTNFEEASILAGKEEFDTLYLDKELAQGNFINYMRKQWDSVFNAIIKNQKKDVLSSDGEDSGISDRD
jgi:hypothetical protein